MIGLPFNFRHGVAHHFDLERDVLVLLDLFGLDKFLKEGRRGVGHHLPKVGHLSEAVGRHHGVGTGVLDLDALDDQCERVLRLFDDLDPLRFNDHLTIFKPSLFKYMKKYPFELKCFKIYNL